MENMESMARFTKPSTIVSDGELKLSIYEKPKCNRVEIFRSPQEWVTYRV